MKATAKVRKVNSEKGNLRGFASVTIDDTIAIRDISVREGENGLYIQFPSRSYKDTEGNTKYSDIAFPVTADARKAIVDAVITAYEAAAE